MLLSLTCDIFNDLPPFRGTLPQPFRGTLPACLPFWGTLPTILGHPAHHFRGTLPAILRAPVFLLISLAKGLISVPNSALNVAIT